MPVSRCCAPNSVSICSSYACTAYPINPRQRINSSSYACTSLPINPRQRTICSSYACTAYVSPQTAYQYAPATPVQPTYQPRQHISYALHSLHINPRRHINMFKLRLHSLHINPRLQQRSTPAHQLPAAAALQPVGQHPGGTPQQFTCQPTHLGSGALPYTPAVPPQTAYQPPPVIPTQPAYQLVPLPPYQLRPIFHNRCTTPSLLQQPSSQPISCVPPEPVQYALQAPVYTNTDASALQPPRQPVPVPKLPKVKLKLKDCPQEWHSAIGLKGHRPPTEIGKFLCPGLTTSRFIMAPDKPKSDSRQLSDTVPGVYLITPEDRASLATPSQEERVYLKVESSNPD
ncbi:unnamed protein product [Boreogadus saida]